MEGDYKYTISMPKTLGKQLKCVATMKEKTINNVIQDAVQQYIDIEIKGGELDAV